MRVMSRHYSEEDLTLYYYGEGARRRRIEQHLHSCAACAAAYRDIAETLSMIAAPAIPERGDQYGREVWQRIRHRLVEPQRAFGLAGLTRVSLLQPFTTFTTVLAFATAAAVVIAIAFVAGRYTRRAAEAPVAVANRTNVEPSANANARRILLTSVADHLDQSERILTDVMNAPATSDISAEQQWAEDLVSASRLYRQDALEAGEVSVAAVLDDLERSLVEIVHSPARISAADLEQIRRRIDAAALLFKVRILSDELRQQEASPAGAAQPRISTRKIG